MWNNKTKGNAIRQLIINLGDIAKTQEETGIPERTLERWKQEIKAQGSVIYWENDSHYRRRIDKYEKLRDGMIFQIQNFLNQMVYLPPKSAADYAMAVARMTDRVYKLEQLIELSGQFEIRISLDKLPTFTEGGVESLRPADEGVESHSPAEDVPAKPPEEPDAAE